jgi:hypothetical protein
MYNSVSSSGSLWCQRIQVFWSCTCNIENASDIPVAIWLKSGLATRLGAIAIATQASLMTCECRQPRASGAGQWRLSVAHGRAVLG